MSDLCEKLGSELSEELSQLHRRAKSLELPECHQRVERLLPTLEGHALGELLLIRAQLKLLSMDSAFGRDLSRAAELLKGGSAFKPLLDSILFLDPNSFILFSRSSDGIGPFLDALHAGDDLLLTLCGKTGQALGRQIESEICYYSGDFERAIDLADHLLAHFTPEDRYDRAMMACYTLLRCRLALGYVDKVESTIVSIISWTKRMPLALNEHIYRTIRAWLNLTTGWGGDTMRYHVTPNYEVYPVLEDRAEAMSDGIDKLGPTEVPFLEYARLNQPDVYTMRELYTDIYRMMLSHKYGDRDDAAKRFDVIYPSAAANGLVMPFAEYGEQILPVYEYVCEAQPGRYDAAFMDKLARLSIQYEQGLRAYRDE